MYLSLKKSDRRLEMLETQPTKPLVSLTPRNCPSVVSLSSAPVISSGFLFLASTVFTFFHYLISKNLKML